MDEAADDISALYERHAQAWDRRRNMDIRLEAAWLDRFTVLLPEQATILDLGCGMGRPIAQYFTRAGHSVTGVDASPQLIAFAERYLPEQTWLVGDMRRLSLSRMFDGILAWHSFFHLTADDQRAMFARFADHCMPGGALMFTSGPAAGVAMGTMQGDPLYHASLDPDEYRTLLATHAFDVVDHRAEDPDCGGATVWLARKQT